MTRTPTQAQAAPSCHLQVKHGCIAQAVQLAAPQLTSARYAGSCVATWHCGLNERLELYYVADDGGWERCEGSEASDLNELGVQMR